MGILFLLVMIAAAIVINIWDTKRYGKIVRRKLKNSYGQQLTNDGGESDRWEEIAIYDQFVKKDLPEDERVDAVTWCDLDMDTVFKQMNRTVSFAGEQLLYSELHRLPKEKSHLYQREKMIEYFSGHAAEREKAQALLFQLKKEPVHYYIPQFMELLEMQRLPFPGVCKGLLSSLLILAAAALLSGHPFVITAFCLNVVVNIAVYALGKVRYEIYLESLGGMIYIVKAAEKLSQFQGVDSQHIETSISGLKAMARMMGAMERKKQSRMTGDVIAVASDYLIGALMWDFIVYDRVVRILEKKQQDFMALYQFVGEVDMCIAIASYRASLQEWCVPEFSETKLTMTGIYHSLIENAVGNDFEMQKNILITGSNASGKSTFIKAVAVNMILGQSMHTCTARAMTIPDVCVLTSMAVRDDVLSGESYYMREIRYMRRMIERSCGQRKIFCAIDEILRGTNTKERIAASIAILRYLDKMGCKVMVATHDVELTAAMEGTYENYYFCEMIQDGDVVFDYLIRKGISQMYNAIRLLEQTGFPKEIIKQARQELRK